MTEFVWTKVSSYQDEELPADLLDRAKHANFLTDILLSETNFERSKDVNCIKSHVLNINADWGAGKTYFLKKWAVSLKHHHPVVYIDTWSLDYLESPLITVLSELIEQLKEQVEAPEKDLAIKSKELIKAAAPKVASALMKRFLGFDLTLLTTQDENQSKGESNENKTSNAEINFAAAGEAILNQFYNEHKSHRQNVENLNSSIKDWVQLTVQKPKIKSAAIQFDLPVFVFIDELDRCKPTYAVEMLEAIKHVFKVPGLVFVIATNTKELQHTIKSVYGQEFNAESYLNRFFDSKYFIETSLSVELLKTHCDTSFLDEVLLRECNLTLFPFVENTKKLFLEFAVSLFDVLSITPREAVKCINRLKVSIQRFKGVNFDVVILFIMMVLLHNNKKSYDQFLNEIKSTKFSSNYNANRSELVTKLHACRFSLAGKAINDRLATKSKDLISNSSSVIKPIQSTVSLPNYLNYMLQVQTGSFESKVEGLSKLNPNRIEIDKIFDLAKLAYEVRFNENEYRKVVELANSLDLT